MLACHAGDAVNAVDLPEPTLHKPMELWTGKQLFSLLIRPNTQTRQALQLPKLHFLDTSLDNLELVYACNCNP